MLNDYDIAFDLPVRSAIANLEAALRYPLLSGKRALLTVGGTVVVYAVLIASTYPRYSLQMLGAGPRYVDDVLVSLTETTYVSNGWFALALIVLYAILTGFAVTNAFAQIKLSGVTGARDLTGVLPGLLASGCASCGAGMLGFLGFAGVLAALPFHGNLLRVAGVCILLAFLARSGDPRTCTVETES